MLRGLLHPPLAPGAAAHLAELREREPVWPPPVEHAGPLSRNAGASSLVRRPLAVVDACLGGQWAIPCVTAARGAVACPRCLRLTPVVERRTGPRLPMCSCFEALCAHF